MLLRLGKIVFDILLIAALACCVVWKGAATGVLLMLVAICDYVLLGVAFESETKKEKANLLNAFSCLIVMGEVGYGLFLWGRNLLINNISHPISIPDRYCLIALLTTFEVGFLGGLVCTHFDKIKSWFSAIRRRRRR